MLPWQTRLLRNSNYPYRNQHERSSFHTWRWGKKNRYPNLLNKLEKNLRNLVSSRVILDGKTFWTGIYHRFLKSRVQYNAQTKCRGHWFLQCLLTLDLCAFQREKVFHLHRSYVQSPVARQLNSVDRWDSNDRLARFADEIFQIQFKKRSPNMFGLRRHRERV